MKDLRPKKDLSIARLIWFRRKPQNIQIEWGTGTFLNRHFSSPGHRGFLNDYHLH